MSNQIFTGFTFNNIHSSTYNILRVSGGDRYEILMNPPQEDNSVEIEGIDGEYFFTTRYGPRQFALQLAFDNLSEENLQKVTYWLSSKQMHNLIFDELPYKEYQVKVTEPLRLKVIPFEENNVRIYKGEGEITFTAFYPFAKAPYQTLDEYTSKNIDTTEWATASNMLESKTITVIEGEETIVYNYDAFEGNTRVNIRNAGMYPSPLIIPHFIINNNAHGEQFITYEINREIKGRIVLNLDKAKEYTGASSTLGFKLDSKTKLITGVEKIGDVWVSTEKIYNDIILAGDFIYIEPQIANERHEIVLSPDHLTWVEIIPFSQNSKMVDLSYDYLYM